MAIPVANHKAAVVHAALQYVGQQRLVAVHLDPVEAVERGHHRLRTGLDRGDVTGSVHITQLGLADGGIALVLAIGGAAVADKMLHRHHHVLVVEEVRRADLALQAFNHRRGKLGHHLRVFRIAFIGAAPAHVLRHRHGRRERPFHAGGAGFGSGDLTDAALQVGIAGGTQANVVREQRGTHHIALAMHRIDAEQDRDGLATGRGIHRGGPEIIGHLQPILGRCVVLATRVGAATGQDGPQPVLAHIVRGDAGQVTLHQLAYLFFQRHRRQQIVDALFQRRILGQRPGHAGPLLRMDGAVIGGVGLGGRLRRALVRVVAACQHRQAYRQRTHQGRPSCRKRDHPQPSICSSERPLVSRTNLITKNTEITADTR